MFSIECELFLGQSRELSKIPTILNFLFNIGCELVLELRLRELSKIPTVLWIFSRATGSSAITIIRHLERELENHARGS